MYEKIDKIENFLRTKKKKFTQFEDATEAILNCTIDEIDGFMSKRQAIIQEINKLDEHVHLLSTQLGKEQQVHAVIKNKFIRSEVPLELLNCYDLGQEIFTVINRISKLEPMIVERAEQIKKEAQKNLRKNNNVPKIAKYFHQYEDAGSILVSKKYEKV